MSDLRVLIVGASIAGPMAAYWFHKIGAQVTVIERFPALRTGGQAIDIRSVGVTVMNKIPGMEATVRAKAAPIEGFRIVHNDGRTIATISATGDPDQQSFVSEFEIFRGDLSRILYDLTKDNQGTKYVFGEQVVAIEQQSDGPVRVSFANGMPDTEYDLVVACDGSTSRTRAIGLECGARDHIQPLNTWAAYFSIEEDLLKGSKIGQAWSTPGGRFVAFGPDPTGINRIFLWSIHPRNGSDATFQFREAQKRGTDALKQLVVETFETCGYKIKEILKGMTLSDDFYASEVVRVKVPALSRGRFVLAGDAGYSPGLTGTGTSLAMVGAYLLAGEIGKHKGDITAGLKGYEDRMRPIMKDLQKLPLGIPAILAPQSAWALSLRNLALVAVSWIMSFGSYFSWIGRFFASAFASSFAKDKYNIPDYDWVR